MKRPLALGFVVVASYFTVSCGNGGSKSGVDVNAAVAKNTAVLQQAAGFLGTTDPTKSHYDRMADTAAWLRTQAGVRKATVSPDAVALSVLFDNGLTSDLFLEVALDSLDATAGGGTGGGAGGGLCVDEGTSGFCTDPAFPLDCTYACCPATAPYYCLSNNTCYATDAAAAAACAAVSDYCNACVPSTARALSSAPPKRRELSVRSRATAPGAPPCPIGKVCDDQPTTATLIVGRDEVPDKTLDDRYPKLQAWLAQCGFGLGLKDTVGVVPLDSWDTAYVRKGGIANQQVVYILAHGGNDDIGSVISSKPVAAAGAAFPPAVGEDAADLAANRIRTGLKAGLLSRVASGLWSLNPVGNTSKPYYLLSSSFFEKYYPGTLAHNSLVYLDACGAKVDMAEALVKAGAAAVVYYGNDSGENVKTLIGSSTLIDLTFFATIAEGKTVADAIAAAKASNSSLKLSVYPSTGGGLRFVKLHDVDFSWTPCDPRIGDTITFTQNGAAPAEAYINRWEWDFGDNTGKKESAFTPMVNTNWIDHKYEQIVGDDSNLGFSKPFEISLKVTDVFGHSITTKKKLVFSMSPRKSGLRLATDGSALESCPAPTFDGDYCGSVSETCTGFIGTITAGLAFKVTEGQLAGTYGVTVSGSVQPSGTSTFSAGSATGTGTFASNASGGVTATGNVSDGTRCSGTWRVSSYTTPLTDPCGAAGTWSFQCPAVPCGTESFPATTGSMAVCPPVAAAGGAVIGVPGTFDVATCQVRITLPTSTDMPCQIPSGIVTLRNGSGSGTIPYAEADAVQCKCAGARDCTFVRQ